MRFVYALILLAAVPAHADFKLCNKADVSARVAFGQFDGKAWASQGWWTIPPQKCETLLSKPLNARYYYLYGTDGGSGTWNGGTYFCTAAIGPFLISGRGNCAGRGYDRKGFFAVDTGDNLSWTQWLSD